MTLMNKRPSGKLLEFGPLKFIGGLVVFLPLLFLTHIVSSVFARKTSGEMELGFLIVLQFLLISYGATLLIAIASLVVARFMKVRRYAIPASRLWVALSMTLFAAVLPWFLSEMQWSFYQIKLIMRTSAVSSICYALWLLSPVALFFYIFFKSQKRKD